MEWPKLKNIILLLLALTNLCLFVFVAHRELENSRFQREALEDAIRFLAGRGVAVTQEQLPEPEAAMPQMVERDLEREGALAARLLGGPVQVQARGGEVYRYFNDNGSLQFHSDGAFSGSFPAGALPVSANRVRDCLDLLDRLEFSGELVEESGDRLTFRQRWNDLPLFAQQVTLRLQNGSLTAMNTGRRLIGEPVEDPGRRTITTATALFSFLNGINALGDVCSRVDSITQGYVSAAAALSGPMALTPVWQIVTDTGAYQLDLVTGTLTRSTSGAVTITVA